MKNYLLSYLLLDNYFLFSGAFEMDTKIRLKSEAVHEASMLPLSHDEMICQEMGEYLQNNCDRYRYSEYV